jgi:hypothetical protein
MSEAKYEVFISSTLSGLEEIRKCIIDVTFENGHLPCAMEHFAGAGYQKPNTLDLTREYIRRSDIFVRIIGSHYGTELNLDGQKESFTDFEYKRAEEFEKPTIILLLEKDEAKEARSHMGEAEKKHEEAYWRDREQFDNPLVMKCPFNSLTDENEIKDLGRKYLMALNRVTKRLELDGKGGWNRANSELMAGVITKLNSNTTLGDRAERDSDLKIGIARVFIKTYLPALITENYQKFFFESGSSTAFVAKEFVDLFRVDPTIHWASTSSKKVQIKTNNVIAYIYFLLNLRVKTLDFYPQGIPKDEYGATYGDLEEFIGHVCACDLKKNPENFLKYLKKHDRVKEVLTGITNRFEEDYVDDPKKEGRGMIFMAASGIGTSPGEFEGPHVGSFINMLFKKSILASKCPTVMFLDQTKLTKKLGDRYPVCDNRLTWSDICNGSISSPFQDLEKEHAQSLGGTLDTDQIKTLSIGMIIQPQTRQKGDFLPHIEHALEKKEKPFAIAIGMRANEKDKVENYFLKRFSSLEVVVEKDILINNKKVSALIVANKKFRKIICPP